MNLECFRIIMTPWTPTILKQLGQPFSSDSVQNFINGKWKNVRNISTTYENSCQSHKAIQDHKGHECVGFLKK